MAIKEVWFGESQLKKSADKINKERKGKFAIENIATYHTTSWGDEYVMVGDAKIAQPWEGASFVVEDYRGKVMHSEKTALSAIRKALKVTR